MENGFYYYVHGFTLHSEIECPELLPAPGGTPDVRVRMGSLAHVPQHETQNGSMHMLLNIRCAGKFSVREGREIVVDPAPGVEMKMLRLYLLGSALGCIVHQRGLLPLHANAFLHDGAAVLVLAHSGTGKSTLAATMKNKGCTILADDVCAVRAMPGEEEAVVYPGIPQIKLWKDAAEHLGENVGTMRRVLHNEEKYALPVLERYCGQSAPIKALYVLDIHDGTSPEIVGMAQVEKIDALRNHTYRKGMVAKLGTASANLKACALLSQSVRMQRIFRPRKGFLLDELASLLEKDLQ